MKNVRASAPFPAANDSSEELISEAQSAKIVRVKPSTLRDWRSAGRGPAYFKVGRLVYYRRTDLWAWLQAQRREPTAA
jgi:hypothetical protein